MGRVFITSMQDNQEYCAALVVLNARCHAMVLSRNLHKLHYVVMMEVEKNIEVLPMHIIILHSFSLMILKDCKCETVFPMLGPFR